MKNLRSGKYKFLFSVILALVFVAILTLSPRFSLAQVEYGPPNPNSYGDAQKSAEEVTGLLLVITNLVAKILTLIAGLLDFAIGLGNNIFDLAAVKIGWQVTLSFANLGFVLAIIVIAFATILKVESYAMKKILWKLIAAALLVNFSLVIAGAILSVSNTVSNTMIKPALGENGSNLSNALANAVNPQNFGSTKEKDSGWWNKITNALNTFFEYIAGMIFIIAFSFIIILTFAALFVMLLVRALTLIFLLILSPLAWLTWILPSTEKHWKKWWEEFIRWNIFAPVVFFFIYLAIATANCTNPNQTCPVTGKKGVTLSSITAAKNTASSAASVFDKKMIVGKTSTETSSEQSTSAVGIFEHVANLFVILGLLIGGLYTANKISMIGAAQAMGTAQGAGKMVGGLARRKGIQLGTFPLRSEKGRKWVEKIQKGEGLGRIPFVGKRIGHALSNVGIQRGESLFKQAEERFKNLNDKQLALRVSTMSNDERAAALTRLAKNGTTDLIPEGAEKYIKNSKTKGIFESYGKGKDYEDFQKAAGINTAAANAAGEEKKKLLKEFYKNYKPGEFNKIEKNIFFDDKKYPDADIHLNALLETNPGAFGKILPKLNSNDLEKINEKIALAILPDDFEVEVDKKIQRFSKGYLLTRGKPEELMKALKGYINKNRPDLHSSYSRHLGNRLFGFEYRETEKKES